MSVAPPAIDAIVLDAIARRVFPGAVVLIAEAERVRYFAAYGTTMYDSPGTRAVGHDTIYDIASITKVFTATAALRLFEAGALDLYAPVARYLPALRAGDVRVIDLLTHTSGLDLRLSLLARGGGEALMRAVFAAQQKHPPGAHVAYTNINSLLLGAVVARLAGAPLDRAIGELVLTPLGLRETRFCPPGRLAERIAPTELDETWRGELVRASVHDESAYALGGVAGHAGLFSTAADLHRFCLAWLPTASRDTSHASPSAAPSAGVDEAPATRDVLACNLLAPDTIALATRNHTPGLNLACGLGWMLDRPQFMGRAPAGAYGHTGFTGPAIVVVPQRRLIAVVLSNRVYPRRGPPDHHGVTAAIVDSVL